MHAPDERDLPAAKRGDEDAFARLVAPFRRELRGHAYRMLGSAADAEEALQETLLGAWRGLDRFEGRSSLRSWLHTIAHNASLAIAERRPRRTLPVEMGAAADPRADHAEPLPETVFVEPIADDQVLSDPSADPQARYEERESIELAFVAALQHLPPKQRAALILRDVLDLSARETAAALETTPVSIDSALQRAHKTVDDRLPDRSQADTLRDLPDADMRELIGGYVRAFESADVPAITALLADDAVLSMPPMREWYAGRDAVTTYYAKLGLDQRQRRMIPVRANGQPAAAHYVEDQDGTGFAPHAIQVFGLRGGALSEIVVCTFPGAFARFGLPARLSR